MKKIFLVFVLMMGFSLVLADFDFDNGISSSDSTIFDTSGGAPQCKIDGKTSVWEFSNGDVWSILTNGETDLEFNLEQGCYQENGVPGVNCCPQGYDCNLENGECEISEVSYASCQDFDDEDSCENANIENVKQSIYETFLENLNSQGISVNSIPELDSEDDLDFCSPNSPQVLTIKEETRLFGSCACTWREGSCESDYASQVIGGPDDETVYKCQVRFNDLDDLCDSEGVLRASWEATRVAIKPNGDIITQTDGTPIPVSASQVPDCDSGSADFTCPKTSAVPFFTWVNFLISSLIIGFVYLFFRKR